MKHIFIINPIAGKRDYEKLIPIIKAQFESDDQYQIIITETKGHAQKIASTYHQEDDVCLYAVGGDGTAFEILNGINEKVTMAIIPNGTGNDYFKMIKYDASNIAQTLIDTINGRQVMVDYGKANDLRYLNASSMGLDADVNQLANRLSDKLFVPKSLLYIVAALITVLKPKSITIDMYLDNDRYISKKALLIAVMNGRFYGGGFLPTPDANIQDGNLDICVVESMRLVRILKLLPRYFKGQHVGLPEVSFYKSSYVKLKTDHPVLYGCDGEVNQASMIEYHLVRSGLSLRIPKESDLV
ncbi:MAG: diacylglycerol kinase family lipid kinase [Erysipelotrichaceae bacterium]|nr:diacylglycerol kinase family lipid kinase [Erysipelotrichaceae bacterium]